MKVSINTLRFINQHYRSAGDPAPDGISALVEKIGRQLGAVEDVIDFGSRFEAVVIAKVVSCAKHPDADRLQVCLLDDGRKAKDVERNEDGLVQVVCGAPNVREGLLVAWLPPGAVVPSTIDTAEPFVLEARALRGVVSNGMLASARELGIGDDHSGILEIEANDHVKPGDFFADAFNVRDDKVIDIENKMFTHRPDCFGFMGVAREIEGISGRAYKSPDWYRHDIDFQSVETEELPLVVHNELPELVPRFVAITMSNVQVKPSPLWLQIALIKSGLRPINNIVDYTNLFMLETGQPLHAYDYDKVKALTGTDHAVLAVRHPHDGEEIALLNGKTIKPREKSIMIATDSNLIGIGGVMGGAATEVDHNTTRIIIECANFDMYSIRRTAMEHGLFTDAVTRFTKGQSPLQNRAVAAKIVDEIRQFAGGKVSSAVVDDNHIPHEILQRGSLHAPVAVTNSFINDRLGLHLSIAEMQTLLSNVEFEVQVSGDQMIVKAPFWRTDIEIPEDIVEEVGRLYGYDHLPLVLPARDIIPATINELFAFKSKLRAILAQGGANEVLNYTFARADMLQNVGQDPADSYKIRNALSPDLQYYRLSLLPSLVEKVHPNIKQGFRELALYEINVVPTPKSRSETLPEELPRLAYVFAADEKAAAKYPGASYFQAKFQLEHLATRLGIELTYEPLDDEARSAFHANNLDPKRSASVQVSGQTVGVVGEFTASVRGNFKLPRCSAGFELALDLLLRATQLAPKQYHSPGQFPVTEQDLTLAVEPHVTFAQVASVVAGTLGKHAEIRSQVTALDVYLPENGDRRNISFRIKLQHHGKTLTTQEVNTLLDSVATVAQTVLGAQRI